MSQWSAPERITAAHNIDDFDCGEATLNHWLKTRALRNDQQGASRTYVIHQDFKVAAYYCLATGSVENSRAPSRVRRNMPDPIPVMVIGRLAVDRTCQRQNLGRSLLRDAVLRTIQVSEIVGVRALLVHALSDAAAEFYEGNGFTPSPSSPKTLFLPLPKNNLG